MKIGILIGSILPPDIFEGDGPVKTRFGSSSSGIMEIELGNHEFLVISRHGIPPTIPPHMVDHRSNISVLNDRNVDIIISICSTGALHGEMKVPGYAVPGDYIDLFSGTTFFNNGIEHTTPGLDENIQEALFQGCERSGITAHRNGTYVQMRGPRLETRAEVRLLSTWGDHVGMNLGPEATLCSESKIRCGSLLTVDNYANGIVDEKLDFRDILVDARSKWEEILRILGSLQDRI